MIPNSEYLQINTHLGWFTVFNKVWMTNSFFFTFRSLGAEGSVHKENTLEIYKKIYPNHRYHYSHHEKHHHCLHHYHL